MLPNAAGFGGAWMAVFCVIVPVPSVVMPPAMPFVWPLLWLLAWLDVWLTVNVSPALPVWLESPGALRSSVKCLPCRVLARVATAVGPYWICVSGIATGVGEHAVRPLTAASSHCVSCCTAVAVERPLLYWLTAARTPPLGDVWVCLAPAGELATAISSVVCLKLAVLAPVTFTLLRNAAPWFCLMSSVRGGPLSGAFWFWTIRPLLVATDVSFWFCDNGVVESQS